jgi:hypothetical protein
MTTRYDYLIAVGPRNAEAATGHTWRWLRDHRDELGVRLVRVDGKQMFLAHELRQALERVAGAVEPSAPQTEADELDVARRALAAELAR